MSARTNEPVLARRNLLRGATAGGLGAALLAAGGLMLPASARASTPADAPSDEDILNFALNFEYLGAELYLRALTGTGLAESDRSGIGTQGKVHGGRPVPFASKLVHDVVVKLAEDELAHVRTVRSRLGGYAIAAPSINISVEWWTAIAAAAGVVHAGEQFDPYADETSFLKAAYTLEDVCVTALAGALPLFTKPGDVAVAAGFLGVEAAQASAIRVLLAQGGHGRFTDGISALRAKLSGAEDDVGTSVSGNAVNFVSSANGQVFNRTPAQILNIAYGGGTVSNFGFFPDQVNGVIS